MVSILKSASRSVMAALLAPIPAKRGSMSLAIHQARSAGQMKAGSGSRDPKYALSPVRVVPVSRWPFPSAEVRVCSEQVVAAHDGLGVEPFSIQVDCCGTGAPVVPVGPALSAEEVAVAWGIGVLCQQRHGDGHLPQFGGSGGELVRNLSIRLALALVRGIRDVSQPGISGVSAGSSRGELVPLTIVAE